jgi:hypothetical protein
MDYARSAKDRMRALIERVFTEVKNTTVVLATLPPTRDPSNEPYITAANAGFKDLANELEEKGRKIELVDMYTPRLHPEDYSDSIHFKPSGYAKLAAMFAKGFSRVEAKGWLAPPVDTHIPDSKGCYPSPEGFRVVVVMTIATFRIPPNLRRTVTFHPRVRHHGHFQEISILRIWSGFQVKLNHGTN